MTSRAASERPNPPTLAMFSPAAAATESLYRLSVGLNRSSKPLSLLPDWRRITARQIVQALTSLLQ